MAHRTRTTIDLARLSLRGGEGRRLDEQLTLEPVRFGDEAYAIVPEPVALRVDVARMVGGGYSLRLRFEVSLHGPCMRCLAEAAPRYVIDAREIDVPDEEEELDSPYVDREQLALDAWAHDALALALPAQILCREDCRGLCPVCGIDLNAHPDHAHEREPDPRWAKLSELTFDDDDNASGGEPT